ncbi:DUF998 domain-containing protein [Actinomycetaceae bacterium TAE3-ERU4]|nr:DUF998 domain-containing protein [Actinomycetaceae bacterium TAE3-ERU4]
MKQSHQKLPLKQRETKLISGLVIASALCNMMWILAYKLSPELVWDAHTYLSELSAQTQPWSWLYRLGDFASGTFSLAAVAILWKQNRKHPLGSTQKIIPLAILGYAIGIIGVALFPLTCAVLTDPTCRAHEISFSQPLYDQVHALVSTIVQTAQIVAFSVYLLLEKQRDKLLSFLSVSGIAIAILTAIAVFIESIPVGLPQAIEVTIWSIWLIVWGLKRKKRK